MPHPGGRPAARRAPRRLPGLLRRRHPAGPAGDPVVRLRPRGEGLGQGGCPQRGIGGQSLEATPSSAKSKKHFFPSTVRFLRGSTLGWLPDSSRWMSAWVSSAWGIVKVVPIFFEWRCLRKFDHRVQPASNFFLAPPSMFYLVCSHPKAAGQLWILGAKKMG